MKCQWPRSEEVEVVPEVKAEGDVVKLPEVEEAGQPNPDILTWCPAVRATCTKNLERRPGNVETDIAARGGTLRT